MKINNTKLLNRSSDVILNGSTSILKAASGVLISWLVIKLSSFNTWGEFTGYLVGINFLTVLISFGNKDYLLREFSKEPAKIKSLWNTIFYSRAWLYFISLIGIAFLCQSNQLFLLCAIWLLFIFIQSSFDALNLFGKHFLFSLILELFTTAILLLLLVLQKHNLNSEVVLFGYVVSQIIKAVISLYFHRDKMQKPNLNYLSIKHLYPLLPFFLLGFGGLLNDRADLLCVTYYLPDLAKANYQILSNLCTMGLVVSSMVLIPFSKNIYRLNERSFKVLQKKYNLFGLLFSALFMFTVFIVCRYFYQIQFTFFVYFSFFINLLAYTQFFPIMYLLTKQNKQAAVVKRIVLSGLVTLLICALIVPEFKLEGAAAACAFGQVFLLLLAKKLSAQN